MTTTAPFIDTCSELLRCEIAAIETYSLAIDRFDSDGSDEVLERILLDHQVNVFELHRLISDSGAEPSISTSAWDGFIEALEDTDVLLGECSALKILQTGEANGISHYHTALANADVHEVAKRLIRRTLLPPLSGHLVELQQRWDRVA